MALQDELLAAKGILGDKVSLAAKHIDNDAGNQRVGAGSEAALATVADLVADGAERSRIETMNDV